MIKLCFYIGKNVCDKNCSYLNCVIFFVFDIISCINNMSTYNFDLCRIVHLTQHL